MKVTYLGNPTIASLLGGTGAKMLQVLCELARRTNQGNNCSEKALYPQLKSINKGKMTFQKEFYAFVIQLIFEIKR